MNADITQKQTKHKGNPLVPLPGRPSTDIVLDVIGIGICVGVIDDNIRRICGFVSDVFHLTAALGADDRVLRNPFSTELAEFQFLLCQILHFVFLRHVTGL